MDTMSTALREFQGRGASEDSDDDGDDDDGGGGLTGRYVCIKWGQMLAAAWTVLPQEMWAYEAFYGRGRKHAM